MKKVPKMTTINLKTGESKTEYVELTDNEYKEYEKQVLEPFARLLYDMMMKDIAEGRFKPGEIE